MKKWGNKVISIISVDVETYKIKLKYADGVSGEVDLSAIFSHPKGLIAEVLKGQLFEKCFVESGGLAWPNGLELCPDSLRMKTMAKKKRAAS